MVLKEDYANNVVDAKSVRDGYVFEYKTVKV